MAFIVVVISDISKLSGCCVNMINRTVFYTKNGINLGVAFTDVPLGLYPTVGLQTPGEVADANFGTYQPLSSDSEGKNLVWK